MSLTASPLADAPYAATIHAVELDDFGHSFRPVAPGLLRARSTSPVSRRWTTATSCAPSCARAASAEERVRCCSRTAPARRRHPRWPTRLSSRTRSSR
jgi:hypothetical protein